MECNEKEMGLAAAAVCVELSKSAVIGCATSAAMSALRIAQQAEFIGRGTALHAAINDTWRGASFATDKWMDAEKSASVDAVEVARLATGQVLKDARQIIAAADAGSELYDFLLRLCNVAETAADEGARVARLLK